MRNCVRCWENRLSGVTQDQSIIGGPIFFFLHINDLVSKLISLSYSFADKT